jgi:carbon storage regulator
MLVLSRKQGERIVIGRDVVITVLESGQNRVRLGFAAPQGMPIYREEVFQRIVREEAGEIAESYREGSPFLAECA